MVHDTFCVSVLAAACEPMSSTASVGNSVRITDRSARERAGMGETRAVCAGVRVVICVSLALWLLWEQSAPNPQRIPDCRGLVPASLGATRCRAFRRFPHLDLTRTRSQGVGSGSQS